MVLKSIAPLVLLTTRDFFPAQVFKERVLLKCCNNADLDIFTLLESAEIKITALFSRCR